MWLTQRQSRPKPGVPRPLAPPFQSRGHKVLVCKHLKTRRQQALDTWITMKTTGIERFAPGLVQILTVLHGAPRARHRGSHHGRTLAGSSRKANKRRTDFLKSAQIRSKALGTAHKKGSVARASKNLPRASGVLPKASSVLLYLTAGFPGRCRRA